MTTRTKLAIALTTALGMVPIGQALAGVGFTAGDWKVDLSGNVNGFYVNSNCDSGGAGTTVTGGLACTGDNSGSVRNGLLPAAIVFNVSSRQADLDVGVTIGLYPGINSSLGGAVNGAGNPSALQSPGIDARQAFFTFGDASWGSVKIGRDLGLFAKDAILDDMTLLGVGSAGGNAAPSNTSLGRIGIGYIYTDWQPQITYTSPSFNGFGVSAGVFQPLNSLTNGYTKHTSPQIQVGANYAWGDPKTDALSGKVWVDVVSQKLQASAADIVANGPKAPTSFTGTAFDGGVKVDFANFEAVLYGYSGKGVGTTGLYVLPVTGTGEKRDSNGGYVQVSYKLGKVKLGASYGISDLKLASGEVASDLVKRNSSGVFGVYYSLTKSVTLVGEFSATKADAHNGNSAKEKDVAIGGIVFF